MTLLATVNEETHGTIVVAAIEGEVDASNTEEIGRRLRTALSNRSTVLIVDLRLLGAGLTRHSVRDIASEVWRWQNLALIVMIVTGVLLFFSEATKCYYSTPFWIKISALIVSIAFLYGVKRPLVFRSVPVGRGLGAIVALLSLGMWFTVGAGGRWIGFSG